MFPTTGSLFFKVIVTALRCVYLGVFLGIVFHSSSDYSFLTQFHQKSTSSIRASVSLLVQLYLEQNNRKGQLKLS